MSAFRILLADESETVLGMIAYLFQAGGFETELFTDGLEALKSVFRNPPDLVLMDLRTPRLTGTQACRFLKSDPRTLDIPVVLLSSHEEGTDALHAARAGADRFLRKDTDPKVLLDTVSGCLAGRSPGAAAVAGPPAAVDDAEILFRLNQILEGKLFEATLLNEVGRIGREVDDLETTARMMGRMLADIAPHRAMYTVFSDGVSLDAFIVYRCPTDEKFRQAAREWAGRLRDEAGVPYSPGRDRVTEFPFEGKGGEVPPAGLFRPFIVCPIRSGEMVKGFVALFGDGGTAGGDEGLTDTVLRQGFVVMENAWLYRQISRVSVTDGLTGLVNRRHFMESLKKEHARASRYRLPYTIVMSDIDHFKKVNDVHGHQVGDVVLREFAGILQESCRNTDLPARYGGEEFILLLPETGGADAMIVAERIRQTVERKTFSSPSPAIRVTVSLGVCAFDPEKPLSEEEVRQRADEALYAAKREGRNRVNQK